MQPPPSHYFQQQPYYPPQVPPPGWIEFERKRAIAAKSYTNKAVITLLLYMVFFVPGFIANIIYLVEANETRELTGVNPEGWGCLLTMFVIVVAPVLIFGLLFVLGTVVHQ